MTSIFGTTTCALYMRAQTVELRLTTTNPGARAESSPEYDAAVPHRMLRRPEDLPAVNARLKLLSERLYTKRCSSSCRAVQKVVS